MDSPTDGQATSAYNRLNLGSFPGDGQEQFIAVTIMGGTGRFAGATGSFVTHSIFSFVTGAMLSSEIMPGGSISY